MPAPAIAGIIGLIGGAIAGTLKLMENPIMAYFLVVSMLMIDAGIIEGAFGLGGGVVGTFVTFVINALGLPIQVTSFHLLVIVGGTPLLLFALAKSPQVQRH